MAQQDGVLGARSMRNSIRNWLPKESSCAGVVKAPLCWRCGRRLNKAERAHRVAWSFATIKRGQRLRGLGGRQGAGIGAGKTDDAVENAVAGCVSERSRGTCPHVPR